MRLGVGSMMERWERAIRVQDRDSRRAARDLTAHARRHSSEGFFGCDCPLEAAAFSALLEVTRLCREGEADNVDP